MVDSANQTVRKITSSGVVTTLAGTAGAAGSADGIGAAARFNFGAHSSVATDSAGNIYVSDSNNHTIRKITSTGTVTTLAGAAGITGRANGTGTSANFNLPAGVATDIAGNIYVADSLNNEIRLITPAGVVTTLAGTGASGSTDGVAGTATFQLPTGIAVDTTGNVYVADTNNSTLRKVTPAGTVSTLAGTPGAFNSTNGTGSAASFNYPYGICTDSTGNVYMADAGNDTIRKITPAGVVTTVAGTVFVNYFTPGALPGTLTMPSGVAIFGTSLYITTGNSVAVVNNVP